MKPTYSECEKHDLLGCITCKPRTTPRPLVRATSYNDISDTPAPSCAWCGDEFDATDAIVTRYGELLHRACLTDTTPPRFHTYDNPSIQHSNHDADKYEPSIWPTTADRYSDQQWWQEMQQAKLDGTWKEDN